LLSIRNVWREWSWPERAVLLAVAVVHGIALTWGLPASDGWDVDGIAPRDFLPGLIATFTPGDHFTYPPFHLALLGLLTLPVSVVEITRVPSHAPADVVAAFTAVPIMTIFAVVARLVSFGMSLAVVMMVGRFAERIFGRAARSWAMAVCGVEVAGTYYAHTTNLDLPALFWSMLAFDVLARAILADDPKRLRRVGLFVAFAIATKDQAYAIAALTLPFAVIAWSRRSDKPVLREGILTALLVVFLVLAIDGALVNPSGFAARVRFLTGPASQDFAQHSKDWAGRTSAFVDALLTGEKTEFKEWEGTPYFDGCMPVEVMAERGRDTPRFGPMKPVGLTNPATGKRAWAVVQLRQDNALGTLWNIVGFQTKLRHAEQVRVFRTIPGLERAEFARLGGLHRNTFIKSPVLLDDQLRLRAEPRVRFAGQITGCEGYVESAAVGLIAGRMAAAEARGTTLALPPPTTAIGALLSHITGGANADSFQPMNVNFGLFPPLAEPVHKSLRKPAMAARARTDLASWVAGAAGGAAADDREFACQGTSVAA